MIGFGNEKMLVVVKGVYCVLMISVENCRHILYQKKKKGKDGFSFLQVPSVSTLPNLSSKLYDWSFTFFLISFFFCSIF